jgi:hypothetical protein
MDSIIVVQDVFGAMQATPALFKTLTNVTLEEFNKLVS